MNKQQVSWFKQRNLQMIWETLTIGWVAELFNFSSLFKSKYGKLYIYIYHKLRFIFTKKPVIPLLEYVVTTKCTMNCRECNTRIPEFNKNGTHSEVTTYEKFKYDIDKLLKSTDFIYVLGFVGGEPMIANDLYKMIQYAINLKKIKRVFLATNCTILPCNNLIHAMKSNKFSAQISDYRHINSKIKYNQFKSCLIKNNINFNNYQEKRNSATWFSMPEMYIDYNEKRAVENYKTCFGRYCNMICDGVITQCTLSVYMYRNLQHTSNVMDEIVNIREIDSYCDLTNKIINFYSRPYSEFCHYCHWDNVKHDLPCGEQIESESL